MKNNVFFIRAYNDLDHFSPLIWKCVKEGQKPILLITTQLKIENDYRINYIGLKNLEVIYDEDEIFEYFFNSKNLLSKALRKIYQSYRNPHSFLGKIYRKFFFNISDQMNFLRIRNINACIFEWSTPYARGDKIEKYFFAAKALGITTFALPHGCNIFVNSDVTEGYRKKLQKGHQIDQKDTSHFDYYVFQNPTRRDGWIKWGFIPEKTQVWGSLRFIPEWSEINKNICGDYIKDDCGEKLKIVFMQFQKEYNLKNTEIFNFLSNLTHLDGLSIVVKDATREGKSFYDSNKSREILGPSFADWVGNEIHSPALIDWSDLVIVIGGSIGIEALIQGKKVIYPSFLNTNETLYEKYNAVHCVSSENEAFELINKIKNRDEVPSPPGKERLLNEIMYGGNEKFDVIQKYFDEISSDNLNY